MLDLSDIPFCYDKAGDLKTVSFIMSRAVAVRFPAVTVFPLWKKQLRFRDAELVKKGTAVFIDKEVAQVKFVDRTFNCNHAHKHGNLALY